MKISDRIDWPDVQTTDWFYEAIMEATNSHTCTMGDRVETWTGKLPQRDWATLETGWANAYTGRITETDARLPIGAGRFYAFPYEGKVDAERSGADG